MHEFAFRNDVKNRCVLFNVLTNFYLNNYLSYFFDVFEIFCNCV